MGKSNLLLIPYHTGPCRALIGDRPPLLRRSDDLWLLSCAMCSGVGSRLSNSSGEYREASDTVSLSFHPFHCIIFYLFYHFRFFFSFVFYLLLFFLVLPFPLSSYLSSTFQYCLHTNILAVTQLCWNLS